MMNMKHNTILAALLLLLLAFMPVQTVCAQDEAPVTLWLQYDNRFIENELIDLVDVDSIEFTTTGIKRWKQGSTGKPIGLPKSYRPGSHYRFGTPERYLSKSNTYYNNDFNDDNSQFCFKRSRESEHFVIFWAKGLSIMPNGDLKGGASSSVCNVTTLLKNAEKIWNVYVDSLGFLMPGSSTTDKVKIQMFVVNQYDWRADGSGVDGRVSYYDGSTLRTKSMKTGQFHCNPQAASDDVTVAHEIGHTFQYLVSADLGQSHGLNYGYGANASGGNEWWEDCANWQAHKVYPAKQFSVNWANNQAGHHLNIHHENVRYNNCYYQDWWCQLHGLNTVARVWRESTKPEDPVQAYMRLFSLNEQTFADEMYQGYAHIASMDIDRWQKYGQGYLGSEQMRLVEVPQATRDAYLDGDDSWWIVNPDFCPQNYGYNANPLKVPAAGTVVRATFRGLAGSKYADLQGYRKINPDYAGWRYGFVAYSSDGKRTYGEMGSDPDGEVSITVPDKCSYLWFVVMGAPTTYWRHAWDENTSNDEQWPYAVRFLNTAPYGVNHTHSGYPDSYERRDTTIVINTSLAYDASTYTWMTVTVDMDAVSEALGVSTSQMKAVVAGKKSSTNYLRMAGVNANGSLYEQRTITDNDGMPGHWFSTSGNVVTYNGSTSAIFTKYFPKDYTMNIGQYPGKLSRGKTYTVREAFIYTDKQGKEYRATLQINVKVQ